MEVSQLWSVLYFFMLLLLGVGSMLGNTAAILTPLMDSKVISSYLPKEAISGEWARHQGGAAWGAEQRLCPQDSPTPQVTAASSWESCPGALRHSGYVIHPTSGPPHHGEVRWSPQHGPSSSSGIQRACFFVSADLRITMTICTFLKHTLSEPPLSQGTEPLSHPRAPAPAATSALNATI